jgi:hypothetical protein
MTALLYVAEVVRLRSSPTAEVSRLRLRMSYSLTAVIMVVDFSASSFFLFKCLWIGVHILGRIRISWRVGTFRVFNREGQNSHSRTSNRPAAQQLEEGH